MLINYNKAGFYIETINCKTGFKGIMEKESDDLDVEMKFSIPYKSVLDTEKNNCTVKEIFIVGYHMLPCRSIPKI